MTKIIGASGEIMFFTYILQSESNGKHYIGSTDNLEKRLLRHNKGYSKYTKNRGPFRIVHKESFLSRSDAKKREYYLKSLKSRVAIDKLIKAVFV